MSLAKKLNLKPGMPARVIGKPAGVDLGDVPIAPSGKADAVLVFVKTLAEVDAKAEPAISAARTDRIAWIACVGHSDWGKSSVGITGADEFLGHHHPSAVGPRTAVPAAVAVLDQVTEEGSSRV